ncbi:hypothetical protein [Pseudomonas sp. KCJK8993]|uniref:hypothetical protein n=1 Tax=Pseudomonas sp. KCJK8993 TaxID=3344565 RepID=UPI003905DF5D
MSNEMISFPRELSDDLAEFIAEKARVCGGGADEIWEALCERFGQPAEQHQGEPVLYVEQWELDRIAKGGASWATAWTTDGKENPSRPGDCVALYTRPAGQTAPAAMVLPERKSYEESFSVHGHGQIMGWNACLDEVARLNPPQQ